MPACALPVRLRSYSVQTHRRTRACIAGPDGSTHSTIHGLEDKRCPVFYWDEECQLRTLTAFHDGQTSKVIKSLNYAEAQQQFDKWSQAAQKGFDNAMKKLGYAPDVVQKAKMNARLDGSAAGPFDPYLAKLWCKRLHELAQSGEQQSGKLMELLTTSMPVIPPLPLLDDDDDAEDVINTALQQGANRIHEAIFGRAFESDPQLQMTKCELRDGAQLHIEVRLPALKMLANESAELSSAGKLLDPKQQVSVRSSATPHRCIHIRT